MDVVPVSAELYHNMGWLKTTDITDWVDSFLASAWLLLVAAGFWHSLA